MSSHYSEDWLKEHMARKAARLEADLDRAAKPVRPVLAAPPIKDRMNKTERRYAVEVLEPMKRAGEILDYGFERVRLRLADNTWYWPDFDIVERDYTMAVHEVKGGFIREDSWIKLKVAADRYRHVAFVKAQFKKGKWDIQFVGRK
jgi:hypothetical protein